MTDLFEDGGLCSVGDAGGEFKAAFSAAFGGSPEQLAAAWVRNPPKVGRRAAK